MKEKNGIDIDGFPSGNEKWNMKANIQLFQIANYQKAQRQK